MWSASSCRQQGHCNSSVRHQSEPNTYMQSRPGLNRAESYAPACSSLYHVRLGRPPKLSQVNAHCTVAQTDVTFRLRQVLRNVNAGLAKFGELYAEVRHHPAPQLQLVAVRAPSQVTNIRVGLAR